MDCSTPSFPVLRCLPELFQSHVHGPMMPYNYLILCHSLLLLFLIFPSIWVYYNESALCIRWPKYCNFSFSISPSDEYSGLISFRISCPRDSQGSFPAPQFESINSSALSLLYGPTITSTYDYWKKTVLTRWTFVAKVMSLFFEYSL